MPQFMNFTSYSKLFENSDWSMVFDISEIWNKYSNGNIQIQEFCKLYMNYILSKEGDVINKYGDDAWANLKTSALKLGSITDTISANAIFDDIYDWADGNEVLIKTNTENESF